MPCDDEDDDEDEDEDEDEYEDDNDEDDGEDEACGTTVHWTDVDSESSALDVSSLTTVEAKVVRKRASQHT